MIPISDANPSNNSPVITRIIIFICIFIYLFIQPNDNSSLNAFYYQYAAIPCELMRFSPITEAQYYFANCLQDNSPIIFKNKSVMASIFISPLLHSSFLHILGNLWSLWIFGDNVEDKFGKIRIIYFIIFSSVISILGHVILNPISTVPIVGISGVVAAVMGAYYYLFPNARILVLVPFGFIFPTTIKARTFMIFWIFSQLLLTLQNTNISWEAHLVGFVIGYALTRLFVKK